MSNSEERKVIIRIDGSTIYIINKETGQIIETHQVINGHVRGNEENENYFINLHVDGKEVTISSEILSDNCIRFCFFAESNFRILKTGFDQTESVDSIYDSDIAEYVAYCSADIETGNSDLSFQIVLI